MRIEEIDNKTIAEIHKSEREEQIQRKVDEKITKIVLDKEARARVTARERKEAKKERFEKVSKFYEEVFCDADFINFDKIILLISNLAEEHWAKLNPESVNIKVVLGLINKHSFLAEEPKEIKTKRLAGAIFAWLNKFGGKFYNSGSDLILVYKKKVYYLDKKDGAIKRAFNSFFFDLTGVITSNSDGKVIVDTFVNIASIKAVECEMKPPVWADIANKTIYFSMCNEEREILKITKDSVTVVTYRDWETDRKSVV